MQVHSLGAAQGSQLVALSMVLSKGGVLASGQLCGVVLGAEMPSCSSFQQDFILWSALSSIIFSALLSLPSTHLLFNLFAKSP